MVKGAVGWGELVRADAGQTRGRRGTISGQVVLSRALNYEEGFVR